MSIYCVYLTIYRGNKLPSFYIGSTSVKRIDRGYRGSVRSKDYREIWEYEISNNPELFETKIIQTFDSRDLARKREDQLQRKLRVIDNPLYTNRAYANGCFGGRIGHKQSKETRAKIAAKARNRKAKAPRTQESREKMSKTMSQIHAKKKLLGIKLHDISGPQNPMYGKIPANARKCIYDGIEFPTVKARNEYIKSKGLKLNTVLRSLRNT